MTLGERIKTARISAGLSQSELAGEQITRNMLSAIETDKATPSLATLNHIATKLELPMTYFFSDNPYADKKLTVIEKIKDNFRRENYEYCKDLILRIDYIDDELAYLLANCYFELGRKKVFSGALKLAREDFGLMNSYASRTIYDTKRIKMLSMMYSAVAANVQAPLLEFENEEFEKCLINSFDFEFYKYLLQDNSYNYVNTEYKLHLEAKELIRARKYSNALKLLLQIENEKMKSAYNSYLIFGVYSDLEICYKQLADYENAYRYASKRLSLLEAFK